MLALGNGWAILNLFFLLAEASAAVAGSLIASRRPDNRVGWLIVAHAFCFITGEFTRQYAIYGLLTAPGSLPLARAMASPPYWIWLLGIILMFSLLPLYFPNGRLVSPRWRPIALAAVAMAGLQVALAAFMPGDFETPGIPNPLGQESLRPFYGVFNRVIPALWIGLSAVSVVSLVVRFRQSSSEERQQIKWVVYAVVLQIAFMIGQRLVPQETFASTPAMVLSVVVFELLWVAIAIAVLKYRLYDIDILIERTLVYGTLTTVLALVYLSAVVLLQQVFRTLTGSGNNQLALVVSTLAIAALFQPLRARIQTAIDRRFYRHKYDAALILQRFSARLRDQVDLHTLSDDLLDVVQETMQPAQVSLWLRDRPARPRAE